MTGSMTTRPRLGRPRKPDALSQSDRQRRYAVKNDLVAIHIPRSLSVKITSIAKSMGCKRSVALDRVLDEWQSTQGALKDGGR